MTKKHHKRMAPSPRPALLSPPAPEPAPDSLGQPAYSLLLTTRQVCDLLGGISRSTLVRMEKTGKIPGRVQLGGSVRYHREIIEEWVRSLVR